MEHLGPEEARRRYGPNWEEVVEYIEAIPYGFLLNNGGEPNPRDPTVRRVWSLEELERVVHFDTEDGSPDNSAYLRFLLNTDHQRSVLERLASERGLVQHMDNAVSDAGEKYALEREDFAPWFYKWRENLLEMRDEWHRNQVQDNAGEIAMAMVVGRCPETEVFYEMWYWYRTGHWPCGWEGEWPEGRLIVF